LKRDIFKVPFARYADEHARMISMQLGFRVASVSFDVSVSAARSS
jgi:hypothetical protein